MIKKIEQDLKHCQGAYKNYYMTYLRGVVTNLYTGKSTKITHEFLFDTGAAITILNNQFLYLFENTDTPVISHQKIQYGGNIVELPIYKINIEIKGITFEIPAAFDKEMTLTSLLGHLGFLNELEHYSVSKKRRKLTIII
jgi:hypothetical protein